MGDTVRNIGGTTRERIKEASKAIEGWVDMSKRLARLEAIADAWNELEVSPFFASMITNHAPRLVALLDALAEDDE